MKLPAGATLVLQMHYTANGKPTTDRTRIGVKFASEPPQDRSRASARWRTELRADRPARPTRASTPR